MNSIVRVEVAIAVVRRGEKAPWSRGHVAETNVQTACPLHHPAHDRHNYAPLPHPFLKPLFIHLAVFSWDFVIDIQNLCKKNDTPTEFQGTETFSKLKSTFFP